jgi:hypothetical protein
MTETEKIKMQAELTEMLEEWLSKAEGIYECAELSRMMATAALAVVEASTVAEREGAELVQ